MHCSKPLLLLFLILLCMPLLLPALGEEALPPDIAAAVAGDTLLSSAHAALPEGDCWFTLVGRQDGRRQLLCFAPSGEGYACRFASTQGIPQSSNPTTVTIDLAMEDLTTREVYDFPVLTLAQRDETGEYLALAVSYRYMGLDTWQLFRVWSYTGYANLSIQEDTLSVYEDPETEVPLLSLPVDGAELDLRLLDFDAWMAHVRTLMDSCTESVDELDRHG